MPSINWKEKETMFHPEKWTWLEVTSEFNIPLGYPSDEELSESLEIKKGQIFAVSRGEYSTAEGFIKSCIFVFYGKRFSPSYLNIAFLEINELSRGGKVFIDVTKNVLRENKLNQILK